MQVDSYMIYMKLIAQHMLSKVPEEEAFVNMEI